MPEQFFDEVRREGVGAVLTINTHARAMQRLFGNLPANYGTSIDPQDAHVTLVDAAETVVDVYSERDLIVLRNAGRAMFEYLGSLPLEEVTLRPDPEEHRLRRFGRHMAVLLDGSGFLEDVRGHLGGIIERETGKKLSASDHDPHMSVTHRVGRVRNGNNGNSSKVPIPRVFHINGFSVDKKIFTTQSSRLRSKQSYTNRTRATRS